MVQHWTTLLVACQLRKRHSNTQTSKQSSSIKASCNDTQYDMYRIHVTFDVDIMYKRTGFHRLFISQSFASARAIHISQSCASAQAFIGYSTATNVDGEALVRNFHLASPSPCCVHNKIPVLYHWSSHRDSHWISITHSPMKN